MNQFSLLVNPIGELFYSYFCLPVFNDIGLRRIIPEVTFYNDQDNCICYYKDKKLSVELVEFSFPNPLEYAVEVLIFGRDKDGNYPEHVIEVVCYLK